MPDPPTLSGQLAARETTGMRRGEPRRRLQLAAGARQGDRMANVAVLNLSQSGLLLRTDVDLALDEPLMVRLPTGEDHAARVVWSADDLFGCRFLKPLTRAQVSIAEVKADVGEHAEDRAQAGDGQETIGARVKRERLASGLTLAELASLVGVSKPTLWKWESNRIRPRQEMLKPLACALGIGELELVYGAPPAPPAPTVRGKERGGARRSLNLAQIIGESRRAIAEAAGIDEDRVEISLDFGP